MKPEARIGLVLLASFHLLAAKGFCLCAWFLLPDADGYLPVVVFILLSALEFIAFCGLLVRRPWTWHIVHGVQWTFGIPLSFVALGCVLLIIGGFWWEGASSPNGMGGIGIAVMAAPWLLIGSAPLATIHLIAAVCLRRPDIRPGIRRPASPLNGYTG